VRPPRWWLESRADTSKTRFAAVSAYYASKLAAAATAAEHHQVLMDLTVDAWIAGALAAGKLSPTIASALTDDLALGADLDTWQPGWAESADLPDDLPQALTDLLDSTDNAGMPDSDDLADSQADTCAAYACDDGAQAAYAAAGVDQWNSVPDASACQICMDKADSNPFDSGDDGPPWHNGCGCESAPVLSEGT
jgi:hypothetical protein